MLNRLFFANCLVLTSVNHGFGQGYPWNGPGGMGFNGSNQEPWRTSIQQPWNPIYPGQGRVGQRVRDPFDPSGVTRRNVIISMPNSNGWRSDDRDRSTTSYTPQVISGPRMNSSTPHYGSSSTSRGASRGLRGIFSGIAAGAMAILAALGAAVTALWHWLMREDSSSSPDAPHLDIR